MLKTSKKSFIKNEKGMAILELVPTIFIYMLLINFSLGFFGVIHSGILNSIASRNYVFETFRHRPNVVYHRDTKGTSFQKVGYRYSGIVAESFNGDDWVATNRPIAFTSSFGGTDQDGVNLGGRGPSAVSGESQIHNNVVKALDETQRNENIAVKSVWIKVLYGICLNSTCGD